MGVHAERHWLPGQVILQILLVGLQAAKSTSMFFYPQVNSHEATPPFIRPKQIVHANRTDCAKQNLPDPHILVKFRAHDMHKWALSNVLEPMISIHALDSEAFELDLIAFTLTHTSEAGGFCRGANFLAESSFPECKRTAKSPFILNSVILCSGKQCFSAC